MARIEHYSAYHALILVIRHTVRVQTGNGESRLLPVMVSCERRYTGESCFGGSYSNVRMEVVFHSSPLASQRGPDQPGQRVAGPSELQTTLIYLQFISGPGNWMEKVP